MTTPENGVIIFVGASGRRYTLNFYSPDAAGSYCTFATNGLAVSGSQTFWNAPEQVTIEDISIVTGQTVSVVGLFFANDINTGAMVQWSTILTTLNNRAVPHITFKAGTKVTLQDQ